MKIAQSANLTTGGGYRYIGLAILPKDKPAAVSL